MKTFDLSQTQDRGGSREAIGAIIPPKTYESKDIHHDFVQFAKQHSRFKAILPSIVLSQQCCKVFFISHGVVLTRNET